MTEPNYRLAHVEAVHVTSASSTTLADANKLECVTSFPITLNTELAEIKNLNSADGWSRQVALWRSGSGSFEGQAVRGSATQTALKTAFLNGTAAYVHVIHTPAATTGQEKGTMYPIVLESYEEPHEAGALVTFNAGFKLHGPPTPILAT